MLVGPRPDTVTSDNLRSSRSEADCRRFNPGSPVDLETDAPVQPIIPQSTGRSFTPQEVYDVSARRERGREREGEGEGRRGRKTDIHTDTQTYRHRRYCCPRSALTDCGAGAERMRHQVLYAGHSCSEDSGAFGTASAARVRRVGRSPEHSEIRHASSSPKLRFGETKRSHGDQRACRRFLNVAPIGPRGDVLTKMRHA